MSKLFVTILSLCFSFGLMAQSNSIEGTLIPSRKDGAILVLPKNSQIVKAEPKKYDKRGKEIKIPQSIYRGVGVITTSNNPNKVYPTPENKNNAVANKVTDKKNNTASSTNTELTTNWLGNNNGSGVNEVLDTVGGINDEVPSLLTPVLKKYEQPKASTVKETLNPTKVYPGALATQSLGLPQTTKVVASTPDLAPIDQNDITAFKNAKIKNTAPANNTMIDLLPIEGISSNSINTVPPNTKKNSVVMPDLAPVEGEVATAASTQKISPKGGMIDLAPIEGGDAQTTKKTAAGMPDLAPIENDENNVPSFADIENLKNKNSNQNQNKVSTPEKGIQLPKGTILASQLGLSYIVKPSIPKVLIDSSRDLDNAVQNFRPKAGGGFNMIDLAPIETEAVEVKKDQSKMIDLAPIEQSNVVVNQSTMIDLAPIETPGQASDMVEPVYIQYKQQAPVYYQKKPKLMASSVKQYAKKWTKQPPCPCPVPKRKWYPPKKRTYTYTKPAPQQPATFIRYIDRPRETIVYVPMQQQQQPQQQQPQQQQYKQPEKPKEKIVYTDYTGTYKKTETFNKNCNCYQQQPNAATSKDPAQYYNPANYAGMNAGPTSGDYPVNPPSDKNPNAPMDYTFYVNKKGQYSVSVFNGYSSVLISQNGRVIDTKVNDQQTAANTPKYNYFGGAESVGNVPIEYNYNRTVNKVGNVNITYDFEGFIKTIGNSQVQYNTRSRIAQVDNIFVNYSNLEVVNVSPPNNGKVVLSN